MPDVDEPAREEIRQAAGEAVAKAAGELGDVQPVPVSVHAVSGFAAHELIEASKNSDLLVVGSRGGGGGFSRLMLGSISTKVVHHALCPVVVVPSDR